MGSFSEGAFRHHCVPAETELLSDLRYTSDNCAQTIKQAGSLWCLAPGSWEVGSFELARDQTLDEAAVIIHTMLVPQRNKRYQCHTETQRLARQPQTAQLPA